MKTLIEQLNKMALFHSEGEAVDLPAIRRVVDDFGLKFVATDDDGFEEQCHIYEAADGALVNCWISSPNRDGLGFDDQVAWFIEDLITQAQAAEIADVSTQAVNNAIASRRLRGYKNPSAKYQRQAATLVSEADVRKLWPVHTAD